MSTIHPTLLRLFQQANPNITITAINAYDDNTGIVVDSAGGRHMFGKTNPTQLLTSNLCAFGVEGEDLDSVIERAFKGVPIKAVRMVDYRNEGKRVSFSGALATRYTVDFAGDSPTYKGNFILTVYDLNRSGFANLTADQLADVPEDINYDRIQLGLLAHAFPSSVAYFNDGFMSVDWVDAMREYIETLNVDIDIEVVRKALSTTKVSKIYSDKFSSLVDINVLDYMWTIRYMASDAATPLISSISLP